MAKLRRYKGRSNFIDINKFFSYDFIFDCSRKAGQD